jgi:unsaturated chondroitin disaccharide hydrolase
MFDAAATLDACLAKVVRTGTRIGGRLPYRTQDGRFDDHTDEKIASWTNGFWPGLLWLAHERTGDPRLAAWATESEVHLDRALHGFFDLHHDVGFMWHPSAVARHTRDRNRDSLRRGLLAATVLASRFNLAGRFIRAWNEHYTGWAIIDCLMNLPLLYWASAQTGDPRFRQIAIAHTETVIRHFLRADGSSRHIVEFDPEHGGFVRSHRGQGYADESAWSRGCSWLVHGLALAARSTGRADFLAAAEHGARYFLDHLPADRVPWCDFKAPGDQPKDASAAAIAASGLLTLADLVPVDRRALYHDGAVGILASLAAHYRAPDTDEALLLHGCVAYHSASMNQAEERDTTMIYADYFFVEALVKLQGGQGLF